MPSPYLMVYHAGVPIRIIIDTGATTSLIRLSIVTALGLRIYSPSQTVKLADSSTRLDMVGEIRTDFIRGSLKLHCSTLVVKESDVDAQPSLSKITSVLNHINVKFLLVILMLSVIVLMTNTLL